MISNTVKDNLNNVAVRLREAYVELTYAVEQTIADAIKNSEYTIEEMKFNLIEIHKDMRTISEMIIKIKEGANHDEKTNG